MLAAENEAGSQIDAHKALWASVMLQALADIRLSTAPFVRRVRRGDKQADSYLAEARAVIREAGEWFADNDDAVGSFVWICRILDLEPEAVRREAFDMRAA